ncbi:MAG: glycosyl hydrolase [Synechococcales cyanobacterium CRU_2_2]|nr:glycosyl hydrolase [Synechococcales cyanobacterium CRU_2_2]
MLSPNPSPQATTPSPPPQDPFALLPGVPTEASPELLQESWQAYRQRFIQADGRVIDWEAEGRSTSESQAYAMLRAVLIDDRETFDRTLKWGEDNLQRRADNRPAQTAQGGAGTKATQGSADRLWAWKWGALPDNQWGILDRNFAVDADIDAATALILAARRWNEPAYLTLAQAKLQDIWNLSTVVANEAAPLSATNRRYLLPGPKDAFKKTDRLILNPSYYAPYAFRLFAQVDPPAHSPRDWNALAETSYVVLNGTVALSPVGLPGDWVALDRDRHTFSPLLDDEEALTTRLTTQYAFDAYRVWWRVALDAQWFEAAAAESFLRQNLVYLADQWRSQQSIPAQLSLAGDPLVDYEATSQYGMLYAAFKQFDPKIAQSMFQRKLFPSYQNGLWDDTSAYYSQNLAWLGLFPTETLPPQLLQP